MKLYRAFCLLITPLVMASCGSLTTTPSDAPSIVIGPNESRVCGQGRVQFPPGVYQVEVVSSKGTYYVAPERIHTAGVLMGRAERGGIFVSNLAGNPQAAWFGDLRDTVGEKPSTMFGAMGVSSAKLWPYTPRVPYRVKK